MKSTSARRSGADSVHDAGGRPASRSDRGRWTLPTVKNELAEVLSDWLKADPERTPHRLADASGLSVRTIYYLLRPETKGPPIDRTVHALAGALPEVAERIYEAVGRMSVSGSPLALLVKSRLTAKGLSYRDAEALAERKGLRLDKSQISQIVT